MRFGCQDPGFFRTANGELTLERAGLNVDSRPGSNGARSGTNIYETWTKAIQLWASQHCFDRAVAHPNRVPKRINSMSEPTYTG